MTNPERILIIRPSALGDVCRSVPVLASLRAAYPGARIDWLVQGSFADAVRFHPGLTGVVKFERKAMSEGLWRGKTGALRAFLKQLRGARYDIVYDVQGLARSGFFAWATRAPRRVGYANAREMGWLGYTERHAVEASLHAVDRMVGLVRASGVDPVMDMRLYTSEQDRAAVMEEDGLRGRRFAVVAPTSRWEGKRWPAERFASVVPELLKRGFEAVVVVGSAGEREQCGPVLELAKRNPRVLDRVGKTSVGRLMALIEASELVIANDSAALHMAVGFGRRIVGLFGPTRLSLVGPYRRDGEALQHVTDADRMDHKDEASGRALMERISVGEVLERVGTLGCASTT